MNKQGRFTAVLLSGVILCGIGTGCAADGSKTAKADYTWSNVAIGGGGYVTGMEYNPKEEGLVYARTDIGGLYRRKKDTDWEPLTDFLGGGRMGLYRDREYGDRSGGAEPRLFCRRHVYER